MKNFSIVLLAALSFAACKKGGGASECASVVPAAIDRMMPDMKKEMAGIPDDKLAAFGTTIKGVMVKRCTEDKWSADTLKCMSNGKTGDELQKCSKALPKDQQDKVDHDMEEAMKPLMADMMKAAGAGAPPAGDMAGSAAAAPAGSAAAPAGDMAGSAAMAPAGSAAGSAMH